MLLVDYNYDFVELAQVFVVVVVVVVDMVVSVAGVVVAHHICVKRKFLVILFFNLRKIPFHSC